jgi:hypothetical protein
MSLLMSQVCSSGQDTTQLSSCNKATFHYSNASPTPWVVFVKSTTLMPPIARQREHSMTKKKPVGSCGLQELYRLLTSKLSYVQNCTLLGYYTANSSNFLLMFRDNLSVPSSGFKNPKESL